MAAGAEAAGGQEGRATGVAAAAAGALLPGPANFWGGAACQQGHVSDEASGATSWRLTASTHVTHVAQHPLRIHLCGCVWHLKGDMWSP